jgi:hypothetical protein
VDFVVFVSMLAGVGQTARKLEGSGCGVCRKKIID